MVLQVGLFLAVIGSGFTGPRWSGPVSVIGAFVGATSIVLGVALAAAGILRLRRQLTAFPRPVPEGELVEDGAFRLVRHPMYGGAVIAGLGWALLTASVASIALGLVLAVFFDLKSRREEAWLDERFEGYAAYQGRTRRLIPWLY